MKLTVIDYYGNASSPHKDPISIPRSLCALGASVNLVSRFDMEEGSLHGLPVQGLTTWLKSGLREHRPDCVIAISRFDPNLIPVLRTLKSEGVPIIVKGDTDGTLGYPLLPNYLRTVPAGFNPRNLMRHLKWRMPFSYFVSKKLEHISLSDFTVYESPGAGVNLAQVLSFWNMSDQARKLLHIPNAVSTVYSEAEIRGKSPMKVVSVGRWDDVMTKGTDLLASVITQASLQGINADFVIIGNNSELVRERLPDPGITSVKFYGALQYEAVQQEVSTAEVILAPSRLESFSLACAEALCVGTSVVVTPIESFSYLAGGGRYGTIARSFQASSITAALQHELQQWKSQRRSAIDIAEHWRNELREERVGRLWMKVVEKAASRKI